MRDGADAHMGPGEHVVVNEDGRIVMDGDPGVEEGKEGRGGCFQ